MAADLQSFILFELDGKLFVWIFLLPSVHPVLQSLSEGVDILPMWAVMLADIDAALRSPFALDYPCRHYYYDFHLEKKVFRPYFFISNDYIFSFLISFSSKFFNNLLMKLSGEYVLDCNKHSLLSMRAFLHITKIMKNLMSKALILWWKIALRPIKHEDLSHNRVININIKHSYVNLDH